MNKDLKKIEGVGFHLKETEWYKLLSIKEPRRNWNPIEEIKKHLSKNGYVRAILIASLTLEVYLQKLIDYYNIENHNLNKRRIEEFKKAVYELKDSSFFDLIDKCHSDPLKIIDDEEYENLTLTRKARNSIAHCPLWNLDDNLDKEKCNKILTRAQKSIFSIYNKWRKKEQELRKKGIIFNPKDIKT